METLHSSQCTTLFMETQKQSRLTLGSPVTTFVQSEVLNVITYCIFVPTTKHL